MISLQENVTEDFLAACQRLIPQLSSSSAPLSRAAAEELLAQPGVYQLVYRVEEGAPILGMLTLVTFQIPTGTRAWIEDVVVDDAARGHGAGQQLVEAALAHAAQLGVKSVDLTSRPSREAANRLYRRCGFEARDTNVYRYHAQ
ncbi:MULTISPECIES: GNAT family N-acetyltransferase [Actinotignum]|uniref:GNAT family N-acetyltransferase n=1 Tax=Actinotignum timonense TaxID=1870995 RepID=A0AAW9HDY9_9ACTO|nr:MULTISPECIES: GNAT family N-acetyltransferase [Actinotignum]MBS5749352.1 GNAT family N-acetyltransferase [Actinotignum schaalii]MDE1536181.1 GNAT family N-acetyltransferase [Actinotignum schaalii]MDE1558898.1 GNAT family N-acetyltransferase [Actinotignum schaalii]MDE1664255.1 GNAT family N-acetyltransferase [Actinotignum schaalii]MDK6373000.1 GNAT family N-acetyltransferase [Actinotignum timonense]